MSRGLIYESGLKWTVQNGESGRFVESGRSSRKWTVQMLKRRRSRKKWTVYWQKVAVQKLVMVEINNRGSYLKKMRVGVPNGTECVGIIKYGRSTALFKKSNRV